MRRTEFNLRGHGEETTILALHNLRVLINETPRGIRYGSFSPPRKLPSTRLGTPESRQNEKNIDFRIYIYIYERYIKRLFFSLLLIFSREGLLRGQNRLLLYLRMYIYPVCAERISF